MKKQNETTTQTTPPLRAMPVYLRKSCAFPLAAKKNCGYAAALLAEQGGGRAAEILGTHLGKAQLFRK